MTNEQVAELWRLIGSFGGASAMAGRDGEKADWEAVDRAHTALDAFIDSIAVTGGRIERDVKLHALATLVRQARRKHDEAMTWDSSDFGEVLKVAEALLAILDQGPPTNAEQAREILMREDEIVRPLFFAVDRAAASGMAPEAIRASLDDVVASCERDGWLTLEKAPGADILPGQFVSIDDDGKAFVAPTADDVARVSASLATRREEQFLRDHGIPYEPLTGDARAAEIERKMAARRK